MSGLRSPLPGALRGSPGRRFLTLLACCAMLSTAAQAQQPRIGGTAVIAGGSDLQNLNSLVNAESWTTEFINHVLFLRLVTFNANLDYVPQLAQSWRMIGDTAVIFRLRRDVRWHDGRRTSAHDVAFTFNRIKDPETASPASDTFERWKRAQVIDSFTIQFSLQPHVEPLYAWAQTAIMPRHLLDSIPAARMRQAAFNKKPVGNGPFRFVSQRPNERWIFEANRAHPRALGGRPNLDRIIWRVIPENTAQIAEIRTGQVDMILSPRAENLDELNQQPDLIGMFRPSPRFSMITWNGKREPLGDARVRRALAMGLNRAEMLKVLRRGYGTLAASPVPPTHWAFDKELAPLPYDTAGARRLLAQAGWQDRNNDGVVENAAGKPLELDLEVAAGNAFNRDIGELVRANLQRIGVKINVRPIDFAVMIQHISQPERNFDGAFLGQIVDLRLSFRDVFHSTSAAGPFQSSSYSNPEVDRIIDRAEVTNNRAEATALWQRFQRIMRDDQPMTFLWWSPDLIVMRKRLNGVQMDARGALQTVTRWWIQP